jgi:tight adherence protein B
MDPSYLIFGCAMGVVGLAAWSYFKTSASPQVDLREKLKNLARDPEGMAREIELNQRKPLLAFLDFRRFFAMMTGQAYLDSLEKELTQCDIPLKPGEFLALRCAGAVICFTIFIAVLGNIYLAIFVGAFVGLVMHIPIMRIRRTMRVNKFVNQLAEFLVLITNSLRSGQTFLQGVDIASHESPNPIGMEFRLLLKETNLGIPVETSFKNMLVRVPSEDLKIVMSAFSIQRNVGGNLGDIMDQVAAMIRQRIQIQGQIRVLTTQGKLSGAIVGLLPFGLGSIISILNPVYMSQLWTARTEPDLTLLERYMGPILLFIGIGMEILGYIVIYKICDIEV